MKTKSNHKDGKLEGPYEDYSDNGQLQTKRNYKDGKREGLYEYYSDNGQLKTKRNYKNGNLEGPWEYYNEDGSLIEILTYKDGKLVKWNWSNTVKKRFTKLLKINIYISNFLHWFQPFQ